MALEAPLNKRLLLIIAKHFNFRPKLEVFDKLLDERRQSHLREFDFHQTNNIEVYHQMCFRSGTRIYVRKDESTSSVTIK